MPGLSLRQPWAWLVVVGGKDIENRRWNTKLRCEFLIHAAKGMTPQEYDDAERFAGFALPPFDQLERGGFVGRARITGVHDPGSMFGGRWHMREQYGFSLADIKPTRFVPFRGSLGFFRVPDEIVALALSEAP